MKIYAALVLFLATFASAFVAPPSLPQCSSSIRAGIEMTAGSFGKRGSLFGSGEKFSFFKIFTARPYERKNSGGNGGGIDGGNGGSGGNGGMSLFNDDDGYGALPGLISMGVLGDLWTKYEDALEANPILVKACTSLIGFSVGDILAQKFISKSVEFDYQRLARMASFGFFFHGTVSHFFYNKLEEVIPGTTPIPIIKKVFTDQVLWAPIFTFVYLSWMGFTSGLSPSEVGEKIKSDLIKGVVGSWSVWPLVHTIGFKFVPLRQRLLYINCIQIGYNVFLSILGSK